jgi:hypothetical protein
MHLRVCVSARLGPCMCFCVCVRVTRVCMCGCVRACVRELVTLRVRRWLRAHVCTRVRLCVCV